MPFNFVAFSSSNSRLGSCQVYVNYYFFCILVLKMQTIYFNLYESKCGDYQFKRCTSIVRPSVGLCVSVLSGGSVVFWIRDVHLTVWLSLLQLNLISISFHHYCNLLSNLYVNVQLNGSA